MDFHHETQPMPNPLSWWFHHLPRRFHRLEVLGNFVAQLILPFGLFLPQPIATIAAVGMIGTQVYLVLSGNYAWLNWLTIVVAIAGIGEPVVRAVIPILPSPAAGVLAATPAWFGAAVLAVAVLIAVLSWWPIRNMASSRQAMNASFNPFHIVNTYGAFGTVGRRRYEVIVDGTESSDPTSADATWREYEFKGKPGDPMRRPPQVAPYHYRLDWLLWFIPLSPTFGGEWFMRFLLRLLEGDRATLRLLRRNPFAIAPPRFVRVRLFHYRFSTATERRATGAWWIRTVAADYVPPVALRDFARRRTD
jgi:hypothetical protein